MLVSQNQLKPVGCFLSQAGGGRMTGLVPFIPKTGMAERYVGPNTSSENFSRTRSPIIEIHRAVACETLSSPVMESELLQFESEFLVSL